MDYGAGQCDNVEVFYPRQNYSSGTRSGRPNGTAYPLAAYIPKSYGLILVTSQSKDAAVRLVGSSKHVKEVQAMNEDQAVQLLWHKLKDGSDEGGIIDLICALDYIPLVINQAAAYINRSAP